MARHISSKVIAGIAGFGLSTGLLAGCAGSQVREEAQAPSIVGKWKSPVTPMSATQAFQLDFDIQKDSWMVDYTVFGDSKGSNKFVTVHIEGPYELGGPSELVPGAFEGRFGITRKTITAHNAGAAGYLNSVGGKVQGFKAGIPLDITQSGFAPFGQYPVSKVNADYDLVKLDGDKLTFGDRPADNDMGSPDKRPKKLASFFSVKY